MSPKDPQQVSASSVGSSWNYWKKKQGSADRPYEQILSVDPLSEVGDEHNGNSIAVNRKTDTSTENGNEGNNNRNGNDEVTAPTSNHEHSSTQLTNAWSSWLNPLSYIPRNSFGVPGAIYNSAPESPSTRSSTTTSTQFEQQSWFNWFWRVPTKHIDYIIPNGTISSTELKKHIKESRKALQSPDSIWAWYQTHDQDSGQVSVLGTKTEASPVVFSKYPMQYNSSRPEVTGGCVPSLLDCYRPITKRTKIRIAAQLYYNFETEKHLYFKTDLRKPLIKKILVISVVGSSKTKNMNSKLLTDLCVESVRNWLTNNCENGTTHNIESISLEAAKITDQSLESLFKLLINWREHFKDLDYVQVVGLGPSSPLAFELLNILISRNLLDNVKKFGVVSLEGIMPGPYLEDSERQMISYCNNFDKTLTSLFSHNVKVSIVGSLSNLPGTLASQFFHPNISRSLYLPPVSYNLQFEQDLFEMLLIAQNLGHRCFSLMVQLKKYFVPMNYKSITDELNSTVFDNAIINSLNTTNLIASKPLRQEVTNDLLLENNYNLIWSLHEFLNDFKTIKNIRSKEKIVCLLDTYKNWDPQSKSLRDLKYMLEVLKVEDYSATLLN